MRFAVTLLATLALLAAPAAAPAQQSPFAPLAPAAQPTTPTVVVNPTTAGGDGLKTWQEILIFGAGLILLVGIGWAIVSDAHTRAPVKDSELAHPGMGGPVRTNRSSKQKQRARAKAKTGRAQRKRNRGR
jgi:hypothetical protein